MAHIVRYDADSIFLSSGEKVYLTRKKHNEFVNEALPLRTARVRGRLFAGEVDVQDGKIKLKKETFQ